MATAQSPSPPLSSSLVAASRRARTMSQRLHSEESIATAARSEVDADEARLPAVIAFACDTEAVLAVEGHGGGPVGPREHQAGLLGGRL